MPVTPLKCDPAGPFTTIKHVDSKAQAILRLPENGRLVATLTVPRGAVKEPTTFTLSCGHTDQVSVDITAQDAQGEVTTFHAELRLALFLRGRCVPAAPRPGKKFDIFRVEDDQALGGTFHQTGEPRVEAGLDHLSGYILAEG